MNNINQFISKYTLFAIIINLITTFTLSPVLADTPTNWFVCLQISGQYFQG